MSALKAAVFDWAGTIVDFGSRAPMGAFVEVFREFGVDIAIEEARGPMGLPKWQHIEALMHQPRIAAAWEAAHGHAPGNADIDKVYAVFTPLNARVVTNFGKLIPGAAETVRALRERGLKIGSTTGYTRDIMQPLLPVAAAQGYEPDNLVCAGDLAAGRPSPLMMYRTFADLGVWPAAAVVKVDDTDPGIAEGKAAGTWTVGVAISGNALGLSEEEWTALGTEERRKRSDAAYAALHAAGADYVIDSVADLLPVIDSIEKRLAAGERPPA
ncbi:phosphonoacetaldehyde hydrolase [Labrys wisconsinensis]|uniref:Phosphonoacetaldehyde hydrolase n=1 Tax=Labrys wisconsinensis TaxID=425677 RepID=A0ABU0J9D7_9HYPH|nr:phosphonoacetaldehyde hydrolase [Labrys wisconsinensis]MDQ0470887.1 phosphonoacetaldehyde hydrolase [Labrys wisconsinensis]